MQITRATEYAVRCALHLAGAPAGRVVPRREIETAQEIPGPFLGKIAQRLAQAGILRIHQGARGGYELLLPPAQLTLLAVVEAAEGGLELNVCVMNPRACRRSRACRAHHVWEKARRQLRGVLAEVTLAELATPPPRAAARR
jgi:Rrf2 family iron-sulfur cluster assembly transcriptional regulator